MASISLDERTKSDGSLTVVVRYRDTEGKQRKEVVLRADRGQVARGGQGLRGPAADPARRRRLRRFGPREAAVRRGRAGVEYRLQAHNEYRSSDIVVIGTDPIVGLRALRSDVEATDMNPGAKRSPVAHLDAAIRAATNGRDACGPLDRFELGADNASNRGVVAPSVADDWIGRSTSIGTSLGCM